MQRNTEAPATEQTEQVEEAQYTEVEKVAMEQGWVPLEQWTEQGREAADHRTAREFVDRGELLRTIQDLRKHNNTMKESFETLKGHNAKVYQAAYEQAVKELKREHAAAVDKGDVQAADKIVDQITAEKDKFVAATSQLQQAQPTQEQSPAMLEWRKKNSWYDSDEDLRSAADAIGFKYVTKVAKEGGQVTPEKVLEHVGKVMNEKFGKGTVTTVAQTTTRVAPALTEGGTRQSGGNKKGLSKADLSEDELKGMRDFVKMKWGTEQDYMKQLESLNKR